MDEPNDTARRRLADAVRHRRAFLGYAMDALPHGPGEVTLRRVEAGDPGGYRPKTLVQLDRSLGWKPGTSQAILNDSAAWVEIQAKPGFVVMTHPNLPEQPIEVPEAAVPGHEGSGWRVSGRQPVARPTSTLGMLFAGLQRGQLHSRHTDSAPASDSVTAHVVAAEATGAVGNATVSVAPTRWLPGSVVDRPTLQARDAAIGALLEYAEVLSTRHSSDPQTAVTCTDVLSFVRFLVNTPPRRVAPAETSTEQEGGD